MKGYCVYAQIYYRQFIKVEFVIVLYFSQYLMQINFTSNCFCNLRQITSQRIETTDRSKNADHDESILRTVKK